MADVVVANTSAGTSGKTINLLESDQTRTGLETFDRDPSAPFAVTANSAVVTNLDADKLDGLHGASYAVLANIATTSYTPTWGNSGTANSLGNGSLSGIYIQLGKMVWFEIVLTFGTTTTSGNGTWTFTVPVTAGGVGPGFGVTGYALDAGSNSYPISASQSSSTVIALSVAASPHTSVSDLLPFTWGSTDSLILKGWYFSA